MLFFRRSLRIVSRTIFSTSCNAQAYAVSLRKSTLHTCKERLFMLANVLNVGLLTCGFLAISTGQQRTPANAADARIQKLLVERQSEADDLKFHERMLAATSFPERMEAFCTNEADAALANERPSFSRETSDPYGSVD